MRHIMLALIGLTAAAVGLHGCGSESPVEQTTKNVTTLHDSLATKFPAASIKQYRDVTDELVKAGTMPKGFIKNGKAENPWTGRVHVQLHPPNAWGPGTPPTINYVFEAVPKKDCAQLVEALSRPSDRKIFQMNLEPSKKIHKAFPVSKDDGCTADINNVGYTVFAK